MTLSRQVATVILGIVITSGVIYPLTPMASSSRPALTAPADSATPAPPPPSAKRALTAPADSATPEPPPPQRRSALTASADSATPTPARAFTADDTITAIEAASAAHGVPVELLRCLVSAETGGTFSPYAVGDDGQSLGPAQLYSGGLLPAFYAAGYLDPFNPYEALDYMAGVVADGGGPWNWHRAWRLCT